MALLEIVKKSLEENPRVQIAGSPADNNPIVKGTSLIIKQEAIIGRIGEFHIAPSNGLYSANELNDFMSSLITGDLNKFPRYTSGSAVGYPHFIFSSSTEHNGYLHCGDISFAERIGTAVNHYYYQIDSAELLQSARKYRSSHEDILFEHRTKTPIIETVIVRVLPNLTLAKEAKGGKIGVPQYCFTSSQLKDYKMVETH